MMHTQEPEDGYDVAVHHANVHASVAYVQRKSGFGFQKTERLLELALQRGDLAGGDYSGRKLQRYQDDRVAALEAEIADLRAKLQSQERKPLTDEQIRQIDDSTHFHESHTLSLRFSRAIERAQGIE